MVVYPESHTQILSHLLELLLKLIVPELPPALKGLSFSKVLTKLNITSDLIQKCTRGTKYAPLHTCLAIGAKEEETLFKDELLLYFTLEGIQTINKMHFNKIYGQQIFIMVIFLSFHSFCLCLNNLHPSVKIIFKKTESLTTTSITTSFHISNLRQSKWQLTTFSVIKSVYLPSTFHNLEIIINYSRL